VLVSSPGENDFLPLPRFELMSAVLEGLWLKEDEVCNQHGQNGYLLCRNGAWGGWADFSLIGICF